MQIVECNIYITFHKFHSGDHYDRTDNSYVHQNKRIEFTLYYEETDGSFESFRFDDFCRDNISRKIIDYLGSIGINDLVGDFQRDQIKKDSNNCIHGEITVKGHDSRYNAYWSDFIRVKCDIKCR